MDIYQMLCLLKKAGMTQKKIADFIGCTQTNISARKKSSPRPSARFLTGLKRLMAERQIQFDQKENKNERV